MRVALPLIFAVLVLAPPAYSDDFFGEGLSEREQYASSTSLETMGSIVENLGNLQLLMQYEAFAEGRCEDYFEIESAAKKGDGESQYFLSDLYRKGYCVKQDDTRALYWVREAAESGYADAYYDLGVFLVHGIGASKNPRAAIEWLEKATDERPHAYYLLASIYGSGEGIPQNYNKAFEYAIVGAKYGDPPAQAIAANLRSLKGFEFFDPIDAYKWALLAKANGQSNVIEAVAEVMASLESTLDARQIARAQDAALDFVPLENNSEPTVDPTVVTLPVLDEQTVLKLTPQQANSRLAELGLERDRFLFFKAINEDNLAVTALYVRAGASPEIISPTLYRTPLLHAAENGSERVIRFLVYTGVDIDRSINHDDDTAVLLALSGGHRNVAQYLIDKGAKLDHLGIMYNAVEFNDPSLLALLESKGVAIDEDYVGTPLMHAVAAMADTGERHCYAASAEYLIRNGARIDVQNSLGQSLIENALNTIDPLACVELLLESGASMSAPPGQEPLFQALMLGNADLVESLLKHGADPDLRLNLEAVQVPWALGDEAKDVVMAGGSLLQVAVVEQHAAIARMLIRFSANPNAADEKGRTPLSVAKANGDTLMVSVLEGKL